MTQREKHLQALGGFIERVKNDPNVIALLLYGSLAYGTVWEKSDIDMEMIVRDGAATSAKLYCAEEDGIEINFDIVGTSRFKKYLQRVRGGFDHGIYGKGTLVFAKDESLLEIFEDASGIGEDDAPRSFASKIGELLSWMHRAEKWITVLHDPLYAQHFLQICGSVAADMELLLHREKPSRESILRAQQLNPDLMHEVYVLPSTTVMSEADIRRALKALDDFLMKHIAWWSKHILRFLSDGEVKSCSHIWKQCGGAPLAYMAEKGVVERVTLPSRVFKHSKLEVEEVAFFYVKEEHENV